MDSKGEKQKMAASGTASLKAKEKVKEELWTKPLSREVVEQHIDHFFDKRKDFYKDYDTENVTELRTTNNSRVYIGHRKGRPKEREVIKVYGCFGQPESRKRKRSSTGCSNNETNGAEEEKGEKKEDEKQTKDEIDVKEAKRLEMWTGAMREISILRCSNDFRHTINHKAAYFVKEPTPKESYIVVVMEYAAQGDLFEILDSHNTRSKLTNQLRAYILHSVCKALQFLHSIRIIHRDVKPENILVHKKGYVKLADFESAVREDSWDLNSIAGTEGYQSPEMLRCQEGKSVTLTAMTDIWALGLVGLELMAGLGWRNTLGEDARAATEKGLTNVPDLQSLVLDCLHEEPTMRPKAKDLLLHAFLQDLATEAQLKAVLRNRFKF